MQRNLKSKFLLVFLIMLTKGKNLSASNYIIYSKDTMIDSIKISMVVYKENETDDITRVLLKIVPVNEIMSNKFNSNKTELIFKKLNSIQIINKDNSINSANDYIYEEIIDSYHFIYNYIELDFSKINKIIIKDKLITNSKLIQLL